MAIINSVEKLRHGKVRVVFNSENNVDILAESILEYKITEGLSISNTKWHEICKASRNRLAIREALKFLSKKRRTTSELEQWLQKSFSDNETLHATERMQELKYLNDESWAMDYQKSYKARGKSKRYLANELKKKNIHPEIQEKALNIHNDETEALWLARKKVRTLDKLPFEKQKTKLYSYLQRRGFNNELIISIARQLISEN
jgi:regulatory protein